MREIYYTKKFTASCTGNEFLAFTQNPLYQILCGKSPVVNGLPLRFWYNGFFGITRVVPNLVQ